MSEQLFFINLLAVMTASFILYSLYKIAQISGDLALVMFADLILFFSIIYLKGGTNGKRRTNKRENTDCDY